MKKYILSILALAAIAFVGCEKDDIDDAGGKQISGQVINFGAGALESRTIYESTDSKQIHWQTGDKVRIYCAQAIGGVTNVENSGDAVAYADYAVTVDATNKSYATIALAEGSSPLLWGGSGIAHKFYAVYPHDAAVEVNDKGEVTFPINRNQICYIQTEAEKAADADASKYTYVARPNMSNAYMVASSEANPDDYVSDGTNHDNVWLDFKPIMTTINIVVKGPQNLVNGQPDSNTTAAPSLVTGVSIISTITTNSPESSSNFRYSIDKEAIVGSLSSDTELKESTETTFISPRNSNGLDAVTLEQGETLCLTAFLPPMAKATAEALSRDIQIRVHTTGGNKTLSLEDATALSPSAKGAIKLPAMYTPITNSNWITPLDGNIYVSQMSIPGTHDAATYAGTIGDLGQTQQYSIDQQWDMGIRAFDFRPALFGTYVLFDISTWKSNYFTNLEMWNWHGVTMTDLTFEAGLDAIIAKMTEGSSTYSGGKDEFAIVIFKHESEIGIEIDFKDGVRVKDNRDEDWKPHMQTILEKYKDKIVQFKPDLTIDECRGKIIVLCRDWTPYTDTGVPTYGGYMGWSHNRAGSKAEEIYGPSGKTVQDNFYIQDCYDEDEAKLQQGETFLEVKAAVIKDFLNEAATFHTTDTKKNVWMINHTSGYSDVSFISGTMAEYQYNAEYQNPRFYSYLTGSEFTITTSQGELSFNEGEKPVGSTGIVMMDWVGTRQINGYTVFGDLLPQAIIDNNYKYRMKRKGE